MCTLEPALLHWCRDALPHASSLQSIFWVSNSSAVVQTVTMAVKQRHRPDKCCPDPPLHCAGTHGHGCTSTSKAVPIAQ